MALRVLLGDESSTIKKVFQLALQDFAVEVRPVNIGVDVAAVAKAFKPDIIFADVLLQKKNGYDVCAELKQDAQLRSIPVVLMWSGFVELDEDKYQASQANAQLEKPFDVTALRKLVTELVPRTQSQNLSQFLTFPKARAEAEKPPALADTPPPPRNAEDDFAPGPSPKAKAPQAKGQLATDKYRLKMTAEELDPSHIAVDFEAAPKKPVAKVADEDLFESPGPENPDEEFTVRENKKTEPKLPPLPKTSAPKTAAPKQPPLPQPPDVDLEMDDLASVPPAVPVPARAPVVTKNPVLSAGDLSAEKLEQIIRAQSAEVIEAVVWKVVPELAAQIIEKELNKLLKERDSHSY